MIKRDHAFFGPGGNAEAFYAAGGKSTKQAPAWVKSLGLNAYEYEAGKGISANDTMLREIGAAAREADIYVSFHAPYFISLSGTNPETRLNSVGYIDSSARAAEILGADIIVIHCGSCAKITRTEAMSLAADTLCRALETIAYPSVRFGIETMGKKNQLGTLEEVIALCKIDKRLVPVVDFGHLNARECGGVFKCADDYRRVFDAIGTELGDDVAKNLHCHFSKIEWTDAGEKKHLTFADTTYGPDFEPLAETLVHESLTPTIICESAGTQAHDALAVMQAYERMKTI